MIIIGIVCTATALAGMYWAGWTRGYDKGVRFGRDAERLIHRRVHNPYGVDAYDTLYGTITETIKRAKTRPIPQEG